MIPKLKQVGWERAGDGVAIVRDPRESVEIADADGAVARLLELLAEGGLPLPELLSALALTHPRSTGPEVETAIEALDALRLLEDERRTGGLTESERQRHFSSLAFFRTFASLDVSAEDLIRALRASHVLVLGVGGLGSNVLQNLCGLGVGRLTLVDRDQVEARNFARQFVYRACDLGRDKVERAAEWVREFDPAIEVRAIRTDLACADDVRKLVESVRPDAVSAGVDQPSEIDTWVNAACVAAGVPFCRAGMAVTEGIVWSVEPGQSACLACVDAGPAARTAELAALHQTAAPRINRGIGPVATQLGSLVAFELVRFLTGFAPPAYAGAVASIDLATDCGLTVTRADRNPVCQVCGTGSRAAQEELQLAGRR